MQRQFEQFEQRTKPPSFAMRSYSSNLATKACMISSLLYLSRPLLLRWFAWLSREPTQCRRSRRNCISRSQAVPLVRRTFSVSFLASRRCSRPMTAGDDDEEEASLSVVQPELAKVTEAV